MWTFLDLLRSPSKLRNRSLGCVRLSSYPDKHVDPINWYATKAQRKIFLVTSIALFTTDADINVVWKNQVTNIPKQMTFQHLCTCGTINALVFHLFFRNLGLYPFSHCLCSSAHSASSLQTALHIVISKNNLNGARVIFRHAAKTGEDLQKLFLTRATGKRFRGTVMMAQLPLSVAALTLNLDMVQLLLAKGATLHAQNSKGDTVLHSLVRYTGAHLEDRDRVMKMIRCLHATLRQRHPHGSLESEFDELDPLAVWFLENKKRQTALTLAATLGDAELFALILSLRGAYSLLYEHGSIFGIDLFDVTEIDTVASDRWQRSQKRWSRKGQVAPVGKTVMSPAMKSEATGEGRSSLRAHIYGNKYKHQAVLEIICGINSRKAFKFTKIPVIHDIVKAKWDAYRLYFYLWIFLHLCFMTLLTAYALFKTRVISVELYHTTTTTNIGSKNISSSSNISSSISTSSRATVPEPPAVSATQREFVSAMTYLSLCVGFVYLLLEGVRYFYFRQALHIHLFHHNGLYRLTLVIFSLSLLVDATWYKLTQDNNHFLVVAILFGWWFTTFGLRVHKKFAFFTVMFQKVLLGDMLRISIVVLLQLLAFSVAMQVTFSDTLPIPDEFEHLGVTAMTLFKLMLGLTDVEVLYEARHKWLAVVLFVLFVLVTYVMLINSFIALLSQTCTVMSEDRPSQWELQTLSVVVLLESMMPTSWRHTFAQVKEVRRYDIHRACTVTEHRYFQPAASVKTKREDRCDFLDQNEYTQTLAFHDQSVNL